MQANAAPGPMPRRRGEATFPEWALREVDRLLRARSRAATPAERAQLELQIAVICDAANRYGKALADTAEL